MLAENMYVPVSVLGNREDWGPKYKRLQSFFRSYGKLSLNQRAGDAVGVTEHE